MNESFAPLDSAAADRFRQLAVRHLEGLLTAEEFSHFDQMLAENAACRSELVAFALQARLIASHLATMPEMAPQTMAMPSAGLPLRQRDNSFVRSVTWSTLGCAVLFAAYFAFISWNMLGKEGSGLRAEGSGDKGQESGIRDQESETAVATITASEATKWQGVSATRLTAASTRGFPEPITPGEPLAIASGLVELKLKQGASLIIEGPARWEIDGVNSATLRQGRLVATVPPGAIGFQIRTPSARVVDLGTEFGVEVLPSGVSEIQVLRGSVETTSLATRNGSAEGTTPARLVQGEAIRVLPGSGSQQRIPDKPDRFSALAARIRGRKANQPVSVATTIPLGNLFDDFPNVDLDQAVRSDTYCATVDSDRLGVEQVASGGPPQIQIAFHLSFDFSNLGWVNDIAPAPANDAFVGHDPVTESLPIRTQGNAEKLRPGKVEDGIGMHANNLLTFDIEEVRAAGKLGQTPLRFVCDRAGINDPKVGNPAASVNMLVLLASKTAIQKALLDGRPAEIVKRDGIWELKNTPPGKMQADGKYFSVSLPLLPDTRYLTLAVVEADNGVNFDHAVWSGARLEVMRD